MSRFIFLIFLSILSFFSYASTCTVVFNGPLDSYTSARDACFASAGFNCGYSIDPAAFGWAENIRDSDGTPAHSSTVRFNCDTWSSDPGYSTTYHVFPYFEGCLADMQPVPGSGGFCACTNGGSYDFELGHCGDPPPSPDDPIPEPDSLDESENIGGTDNDFGGEVDGGAECNFAPEGCAPGDVATTEPDIGDLTPPDVDTESPSDAVTKKESTANNPDGSTTTTKVEEWQETDGSIVRQTTKVTINPDGSKTKETTTERTSPDGSSSSTTGTWDIDSQGNSTLTGSSSSKETEKEGSASGGATCDAPPSCNGDAIQCAILKQQWLTRCDKNSSYTDSDCLSQPQCQGDVLLCAGLINEWQNRCSLKRADYDLEQEFKSRGFKTAEEIKADGGIFGQGTETDLESMADGVFASRSTVAGSCPQPISFDAGSFGSYEISLQSFCTLAEQVYWLVLLSGYLVAAFTIFRAVTEPT